MISDAHRVQKATRTSAADRRPMLISALTTTPVIKGARTGSESLILQLPMLKMQHKQLVEYIPDALDAYYQLSFLSKVALNDCVVLPRVSDAKLTHDDDGLIFDDLGYIWITDGKKRRALFTDRTAEIKACLAKPNVRFVLVLLTLENLNEEELHANFLIFDKKLRTLERFEPHGGQSLSIFMPAKLDAALRKVATKLKFTYISPKRYCEKLGLQAEQEYEVYSIKSAAEGVFAHSQTSGYCQAWSFLWAILRITNPDVPPEALMRFARDQIKEQSNSLTQYIVSFGQFIEKMKRKAITDPDRMQKYIERVRNTPLPGS